MVKPLVLAVMIAAAGLVLGEVYAGPLLTMLVAGAGAGAVLVGVAARRRPSWLVAPLSVIALAVYATAAMWIAADRAGLPEPFGTLAADAARNGIPRLLTAMIPIEPTPDTVLVPVVAAWLAGLAGAELGLRGGRLLAGYGPPVLLYAGALYVVGPNAGTALAPTLLLVAAAALGLAVTGRPADAGLPGRATRVRAAVGALAVVALVVGTVPLVAGRVDAEPVDPRRYVQPPQIDSLDENPLIRISGWALNPDQHLFDVAATGDAAPRIRLAVLSDYDGITWRVGATYRGAGRVLPAAAAVAPTETVHQRITVADLTGRLLPAVATPERVDGTRVAYDVDSGTLIRPDGLHPWPAVRGGLRAGTARPQPAHRRRRARPATRSRGCWPSARSRPSGSAPSPTSWPPRVAGGPTSGRSPSRNTWPRTTGRCPTRRAGTPCPTSSSSSSGRPTAAGGRAPPSSSRPRSPYWAG